MKVAALIPARYDSQRFPGKLLKDLAGKTVIRRTYEAALKTDLFNEVIVITDHQGIYDEIVSHGGKVMMSQKEHATGTDRIAEFADVIEADIIINIQGDEPFINKKALQDLISVFEGDEAEVVNIASLMMPITNKEDFLNPNNVKVVVDVDQMAMYFSRAPIPYSRDKVFEKAFKHIGVYAFRKSALMMIPHIPQTELEQIEKLENLRFLEFGFNIYMVETDSVNFGIDTEEDLQKAITYLKTQEHE
jgi:3-deoxy-manno-octulosonate cytidylyltransferase (CMP-KDO synthetase)